MTTFEERAPLALVQYPNGNVGHYAPCPHCDGSGSVLASWGESCFCHACGSSGRRLVSVTTGSAA